MCCRYLAGEVIIIRYQHIAKCQSLYLYILIVDVVHVVAILPLTRLRETAEGRHDGLSAARLATPAPPPGGGAFPTRP